MTPEFVVVEAAFVSAALVLLVLRRRYPGLTPLAIACIVVAGMLLLLELALFAGEVED